MLRLPIFILLLLALSPAASVPVESELQRDLTQQSAKDFGMRTNSLLPWVSCLPMGNDCPLKKPRMTSAHK
nr:TPA_inf: conotoxin precursor T [Conus ebraeus]